MKKVIALVLSLVFIFSSSINAFAFSTLPPDYVGEIETSLKEKLSEYFNQYPLISDIKYVKLVYGDTSISVFGFETDCRENKEHFNRFDIFYQKTDYTEPVFPSGFAVLDKTNGEFLSLEDAYNNNLYDPFMLAFFFSNTDLREHFGVVGSVDFTGTLNIISVTLLQMDLVKETSEYDVRTVDFNNDGKYNIKDATDIQKYLVGAEV